MGLLTDSQQTTDRLTLNPTTDSKKFVGDDIRSQFGELFKSALQIWRALHISFPNLVTIRLLTDYWLTPDILLTDSQQTSDRHTLDPAAEICWRWHQVSIWRAVWISSPNLESFQNQLSKFGYLRLLTDYWLTPDILLTDSWLTPDWLPTFNSESYSNQVSKFGELSK